MRSSATPTDCICTPPRRLRVVRARRTQTDPQCTSETELVPRELGEEDVLMWFTRALSSTCFLGAIIFTIPLAFDIGGRTCGLAFSLSLSASYFVYSVLRLATPATSRFRWFLCQLFAWTQWLMIGTLLIWSLNKFSVDSNNNSGWVGRTFGGKRSQDTSVYEWVFGAEGLLQTVTIGTWDNVLRYSTPVFQILEGFCSLLVIQASGQVTRWVVNGERGDSWMVRRLPFLREPN